MSLDGRVIHVSNDLKGLALGNYIHNVEVPNHTLHSVHNHARNNPEPSCEFRMGVSHHVVVPRALVHDP